MSVLITTKGLSDKRRGREEERTNDDLPFQTSPSPFGRLELLVVQLEDDGEILG